MMDASNKNKRIAVDGSPQGPTTCTGNDDSRSVSTTSNNIDTKNAFVADRISSSSTASLPTPNHTTAAAEKRKDGDPPARLNVPQKTSCSSVAPASEGRTSERRLEPSEMKKATAGASVPDISMERNEARRGNVNAAHVHNSVTGQLKASSSSRSHGHGDLPTARTTNIEAHQANQFPHHETQQQQRPQAQPPQQASVVVVNAGGSGIMLFRDMGMQVLPASIANGASSTTVPTLASSRRPASTNGEANDTAAAVFRAMTMAPAAATVAAAAPAHAAVAAAASTPVPASVVQGKPMQMHWIQRTLWEKEQENGLLRSKLKEAIQQIQILQVDNAILQEEKAEMKELIDQLQEGTVEGNERSTLEDEDVHEGVDDNQSKEEEQEDPRPFRIVSAHSIASTPGTTQVERNPREDKVQQEAKRQRRNSSPDASEMSLRGPSERERLGEQHCRPSDPKRRVSSDSQTSGLGRAETDKHQNQGSAPKGEHGNDQGDKQDAKQMRKRSSLVEQQPDDGSPLKVLGDPLKGDKVGDNDILCGKHKSSHRHPGNRRFRELIKINRERYQSTKLRSEKFETVQDIMLAVQACGGRFLEHCDSQGNLVREEEALGGIVDSFWGEMRPDRAYEKVSKSLRMARPPVLIRAKRRPNGFARNKMPSPANEDPSYGVDGKESEGVAGRAVAAVRQGNVVTNAKQSTASARAGATMLAVTPGGNGPVAASFSCPSVETATAALNMLVGLASDRGASPTTPGT